MVFSMYPTRHQVLGHNIIVCVGRDPSFTILAIRVTQRSAADTRVFARPKFTCKEFDVGSPQVCTVTSLEKSEPGSVGNNTYTDLPSNGCWLPGSHDHLHAVGRLANKAHSSYQSLPSDC